MSWEKAYHKKLDQLEAAEARFMMAEAKVAELEAELGRVYDVLEDMPIDIEELLGEAE